MSGKSAIDQVREGMEVVTSDGVTLGRVTVVHRGSEPRDPWERCEDEACLEVYRGVLLGREVSLHVPCRAIAGVSGDVVTLNVDAEAAAARGWMARPSWVGGREPEPVPA